MASLLASAPATSAPALAAFSRRLVLLSGILVHDIKNPLSSLYSSLGELQSRPMHADAARQVSAAASVLLESVDSIAGNIPSSSDSLQPADLARLKGEFLPNLDAFDTAIDGLVSVAGVLGARGTGPTDTAEGAVPTDIIDTIGNAGLFLSVRTAIGKILNVGRPLGSDLRRLFSPDAAPFRAMPLLDILRVLGKVLYPAYSTLETNERHWQGGLWKAPNYPGWLSHSVHASYLDIYVLFDNILANAQRAMEGVPNACLGIDFCPTLAGVAFTFKDIGRGMAPEVMAALNGGQRISTKAADGGEHGLGFQTCRALAREMGGDLYIQESRPGIGTTVALELLLAI